MGHVSRVRRFRHPRHGEQSLRLLAVRAPDFAPSIVVFHVPLPHVDSSPARQMNSNVEA